MENPPNQDDEHRERGHLRRTPSSSQSLQLFHQLFKAFLKCLGHDNHQKDDQYRPTSSTSQIAQDDDVSPVDMKNNEVYHEVEQGRSTWSPSNSIMLSRKPPEPPISSGPGGGQIN